MTQRQFLALLAVIASLVVVGGIVAAVLVQRLEDPGRIVHRDDLAADLLDWIPADGDTTSAYAVWTPDKGTVSTSAIPVAEMHGENLGLSPFPQTLGYSSGWSHDFGYSASEVTAWATAGSANRVTVLNGSFEPTRVETALDAAGYKRSNYHGAILYQFQDDVTPTAPVSGDVASAANVVALLGGRLITAQTMDRVKAVVDAAQGLGRSLADENNIASLLGTVAPTSSLMVTAAATLSAACAGLENAKSESDGRYVAVAYGRSGEPGDRRTLVITSFDSAAAATAAEPTYELGWQDGYVVSDSVGAPIANFGRVSNVSQSGSLLIAELVEGRDDGWTRAAIRFAQPVCAAVGRESASDASVPSTTAQSDDLGRALASLPDPGMEGTILFADLSTAANNAGVAAPGEQALASETEAWLAALGSLPTFNAIPRDGTKLVRWPETFGMPLGTIHAIAEERNLNEDETVTVLAGDWDSALVEHSLTGAGYLRVEYGAGTIFAVSGDVSDPSHPTNRAAGSAWYNVAVMGDRIFLSPSSRSLREAVDGAVDKDAASALPDGVSLRDRLLAGRSDVTMGEIVGRERAARTCVDLGITGIAPEWQGIAAFWRTTASADTGEIVLIPGERALADQQSAFDQQIRAEQGALADAFGYQGIQQGQLADGTTSLIARFSPRSGSAISSFFVSSVEGCPFGAP
ncbi:MAG: hypothetical protein ACJ789_04785 [Thermomicrobiales bacterium]